MFDGAPIYRRLTQEVRKLYAGITPTKAHEFGEMMLAFSVDNLKEIGKIVHRNSADKGFWEGEQNPAEKIALIHSELSEALEAIREGDGPSEKIPHHTKLAEEMADVIIRVLDFCTGFNVDVSSAVLAKHEYNTKREHKHGKRF